MMIDRDTPDFMEQVVIGCILIDGGVFGIAKESLEPCDFFHERCRRLYSAMCELSKRGDPIDVATVAMMMVGDPTFTHECCSAYLFDLQSLVPSAMAIQYYVDKVKEHAKQEHAKQVLFELQTALNKPSIENIDTTLLDYSDKLAEITLGGKQPWCDGADAIDKALQEAIRVSQGEVTTLQTGFTKLDGILGGVRGGTLNIIAARPAMGKTAFALNLMMNCIYCPNKVNQCLFFSLEMSGEELGLRLLAQRAKVNAANFKAGKLSKEEWNRSIEFNNEFKQLMQDRITIDDTPSIEIMTLRERAKNIKKTRGLSFIIVDYITLVRSEGRRNGTREQEVAEISRGLKALAKELDVPVFALAQLNRAVEGRQDKHPTLSDLRESGSIEQDADCVMFIHREEYYNPTADNKNKAEIIVAKHRSGPTDKIELHWDGQYTQFSNLASFDDRF